MPVFNALGRGIGPPAEKENLHSRLALICISLLLFLSCSTKEKVPDEYRPTRAHDAYRHSLETAGLTATALGKDWIARSANALDRPVDVELPIEEIFYADPAAAFALGYRFGVKRGQRVEVTAEFQGESAGRLFMDLFRAAAPSSSGPRVLVASAGEGEGRLEFEPRRDASYIVRLQTELLRGGRYKVTIRLTAALGFPVAGLDVRAIQSGFGKPRDGGRRVHHGVDIFAERHTAVLAPSDSVVQYVGDGGIGGNTIWLYDAKRSMYLYFAHLETQGVVTAESVKVGQKIGTVGNSGNARTTPPHLHFGIYMRPEGPVDPVEFVRRIRAVPEPLSADTRLLGAWARTTADRVSLRATNGRRSAVLSLTEMDLPVKVLAASGGTYRVALPDGTSGYVAAAALEPAEAPLENRLADSPLAVLATKGAERDIIGFIETGQELSVLGRAGENWLVRTPQGLTGWIQSLAEPNAHTSAARGPGL